MFTMRVVIQNKLPGEAQGFPVLGSVQDWTGKVPKQADLNRPTLSWTDWSPNLNYPLIRVDVEGNMRGAPCRKGQAVCQKKPTEGSRNTDTWLCKSSVGQHRKQRALAWWGGLSRSPLMSLCPGEGGLPLPSQTLLMPSRMAQWWELCYQAWEGAGVHGTHTRHAHTAGCWHQIAANTAAAATCSQSASCCLRVSHAVGTAALCTASMGPQFQNLYVLLSKGLQAMHCPSQ